MAPVPAYGAPETRCLSQPRPAGPSVMPGRRGCPALAGRCSRGYRTEYSTRQKALGQTDGQSETALDSFPSPSANEQPLLLAPPGGRRGSADSPRRWGVQLGLCPADRGWGLHAPHPPDCLLLRGTGIPGLGAPGSLGRGRRWRRGRTTRSRSRMGTQEARPPSASVRAGGSARSRGRRGPGAASGPERHRPPVDPPSLPSAPRRIQGLKTQAAEGRHPFPRVS